MKVLLAYTSKTGTTQECIDRLRQELPALSIDKIRLDEQTPDPDNYDILVIGAPVRFGKLPKQVSDYLHNYQDAIQRKPHALFLCCGYAHEYEYYMEKLLPLPLRESAFAVLNFGGTLNYKGQTLFEKLVIHHMRSAIRESEIEDYEYTPEYPGILPETIGKLATYIRRQTEELAKK